MDKGSDVVLMSAGSDAVGVPVTGAGFIRPGVKAEASVYVVCMEAHLVSLTQDERSSSDAQRHAQQAWGKEAC